MTGQNPVYANGKNPWILLLALTAISVGGVFFIGQVLALVSVLIMTGAGFDEITAILTNPTAYPEQRLTILTMQGMASLGGFIIAPLIFYYTLVKGNLIKDFINFPSNLLNAIIVIIAMVFSFMVVNTVFIEWNASISLPESLSGIERWAENLEDSME